MRDTEGYWGIVKGLSGHMERGLEPLRDTEGSWGIVKGLSGHMERGFGTPEAISQYSESH